MFRTAYSYRG